MAAPRPLQPVRRTHRPARGFVLIEALIAILIFSIGILGVVGLQATSVQQSTEARYRAEAAMLADQLIGTMWASNRVASNLQAEFDSDCTGACSGYNAWVGKVAATLPGVSLTSTTKPEVQVSPEGVVNVSVFWKAPWEGAGADRHRYDVSTQIGQ